MPVNRNALIRYKTIDNCLRNRYKKWTIEDLIDACSEALYEYEGIDKGVSRRTIQLDIQVMRSEKLGYNAPIIVEEKKYYTYEDAEYSITNIPLTDQDLGKLGEVMDILKQFKGFSHFQDLNGMIQKLEDKIHVKKTKERPIIDLEKNDNLKGLHFIDPIYQAILQKKCLELSYQSFNARFPNQWTFHPALLKEFRNRWFLLGRNSEQGSLMLLALDRIITLEISDQPSREENEDQIQNYFSGVIGVSVSPNLPTETIELFLDHRAAPYVLTKPIHHSQSIIEKTTYGIIIQLQVQCNFELEREILGFGESIKVLAPANLRRRIYERHRNAKEVYDTDLNQGALKELPARLDKNGHQLFKHLYSKRETNKMKQLIHQYDSKRMPDDQGKPVRFLFREIPQLVDLCFNENLNRVLKQFGADYFLTKATLFAKTEEQNWLVSWHQDTIIYVKNKIESPDYTNWTRKQDYFGVQPPERVLQSGISIRIHLDDTTAENGALRVLSGSHLQLLEEEKIEVITKNSNATTCELEEGDIHLFRPLLLHASGKSTGSRPRRVIQLEFNCYELDNGLEWASRITV